MRQLRYSVACSLDGCIAGPNGEYDWIPMDPDIDFAALYASFSAIVMGRRSYEVFAAEESSPAPKMPVYVYSRSLPEGEREGVTFAHDGVAHVRSLKAADTAGKDAKPLWLWGGGELLPRTGRRRRGRRRGRRHPPDRARRRRAADAPTRPKVVAPIDIAAGVPEDWDAVPRVRRREEQGRRQGVEGIGSGRRQRPDAAPVTGPRTQVSRFPFPRPSSECPGFRKRTPRSSQTIGHFAINSVRRAA
jgi:hypothetical protein